MDLLRHLRFLALLIFILAAYSSTVLARQHRHHHGRHKRQQIPGSYILDVPGVEAGDWGPWTLPSPCSRTCGGGVAYQTRQCREDTRVPCKGATKRFFSCNIQDCPEGSVDFRAEQCAAFNTVPFDDIFYEWIPYTKAPNKCELNCMPRGERFYYRHNDKVVDGTRCEEEKLDVCVDGKCLPVGCDNLLGSSAREDQCRECGGDGSSCNTATGLLDMDDLQVGYNDILLIPAGATNIKVQEIKASNNYLAIRNVTGHYYLNGNWRIDFPRSIRCAGTIFHYERKPHGFFAPETITALGPTTEAVYIVLLYQERNPGIQYEYSIPKGSVSQTDSESYSWVYNEFSSCSATCGGGVQNRDVWCAKRKDSTEVSSDLCDSALRPPSSQNCAVEPCPAQWSISDWSLCSQTCGDGGTQTRQVICEQIVSNGRASLVNSSVCEDTLGPAPRQTRVCEKGPPCPTWHIAPWKPCDRLCGTGKQRRQVRCFRRIGGKIEVMGDSACAGDKPETEKSCHIRPCEGVDWVVTEWSGCQDKCGLTYETRQAHCSTLQGKIYPDNFCHKYRIPQLLRPCESATPCKNQWFASQWSDCSAKCGTGVQMRKVFCGTFDDECVKKTDDSNCNPAVKYEDTRNCTGKEECKGHWFAGPWSQCTKPCGGGMRVRKVLCFLDNQTVDATHCDPDLIVFSNEDCNNHPCGADEIIPFESKRKVTEQEEEEEEECEEEESDFITMDTTVASEGVFKFTSEIEGSGTQSELSSLHSVITSDSSSSDIMLSDSTNEITGDIDPKLLDSSNVDPELHEGSGSADIASTNFLSFTTDEGSGFSGSTDVRKSTEVTTEESTRLSTESLSSVSSDTTQTFSASSGTSDRISTVVSDSTSESPIDFTSLSSSLSSMSAESFSVSDMVSTSETVTESTFSTPEETSETTIDGSSSTFTDLTVLKSDTTENTVSSYDSSLSTYTILQTTMDFSEASSASVGLSAELDISETSFQSSTEKYESSSITLIEESETSSDMSTSESELFANISSEETTVFTPLSINFSSESSSFSLPTSDTTEFSSSQSLVTEESVSPYGLTEESAYSTSTVSFGASTSTITALLTQSPVTATTTTSVPKKRKTKKCKRKKKPQKISECELTEFGCCYDNVTAAKGPFSKGCPVPETCKETKFGCCQDGVSPALGPDYENCPPSQCNFTLFGCCPDGVSIAEGNDYEGCPEEVTVPPNCKDTKYGCCPNGVQVAAGPDYAGCFVCEGSGSCETCNDTRYGCCPDGISQAIGPDFHGCDLATTETYPMEENVTEVNCITSMFGCCPDGISAASGPQYEGCEDMEPVNCSESSFGCCPDGNTTASGPNNEGCPPSCNYEPYGCCDDDVTPAHGPNKEGCCLNTLYGCCPDNILSAQGPNLEGCGCQYTAYGCCPDNKTIARGPDNQGCGCQYTQHGCCPNKYTPAAGPNFQGCSCYTYQFGCCPDGVTRAIGPNLQGCGCENTEFGCCPDGRTPAPGPNRDNCSCAASRFGCCPDGISEAQGEHFQGCEEVPLTPGESCSKPKDRGPCREFTVKWFFDTEYGGCSRFWYGGCGGNENRFRTQEECRATCVEPIGRDACYLPKIEGPCEGYYPTWYYDSARKQCGQFAYGGCLGNNNKFETREACEELCVIPDTLDACEQQAEEGPCRGNFTRWYFDKEHQTCSYFNYGGCKANKNNFLTELACQQKCLQPGRSREICSLAKDPGPCPGAVLRWYFDSDTRTCKQFVYGGCQGNANRFRSEDHCVKQCTDIDQDECSLPRAQGNCGERLPRWFFDASENRCMPFYYSGCEGNGNRFESYASCEEACPSRIEQETCLLPALVGDCHNYTARWYYDSLEARCKQFYYGGCGGNSNNFQREDECQRYCDKTYVAPTEPTIQFSTDMCFLSDDHGSCENSVAHWFYDSRVGICKQFLYGGCGGNGNRFITRQECEQKCGYLQDVCTLPRVVGPCSGSYVQWFYDQASDSCQQFDYGGCQGNGNRFGSQEECEQKCQKVRPPQPVVSTTPPSQEHKKSEICYAPVDPGPCSSQIPSWYYNNESGKCQAFVYGGCEGNANRFESIEQCERHCGEFLGQDVCNVPVDVGPCLPQFHKWYYDPVTTSCQEFQYGGCYGSANRFSTLEECESICLHREELLPTSNSSLSYLAICKLPVDPGPCADGQFTRWYFDDTQQTCVSFIYNGCAGNLNRFKSFKACLAYCRPGLTVPGTEAMTVQPNEVDTDLNTHINPCAEVTSCSTITNCEYGIEKWVGANGCEECRCHNPCITSGIQCPSNTTCAVLLHRNQQSGDTEYRAVCRPANKVGECPHLSAERSNCDRECKNDADCDGTDKCCYNGCGTSCVEPVLPATQAPTEAYPVPPGASAPSVQAEEPEVESEEGHYVTLRCVVRGTPTPTITWLRGQTPLSALGGRYKFLVDGSMQIIGLIRTDAGIYICRADNGIGSPVEKEFIVRVKDPFQGAVPFFCVRDRRRGTAPQNTSEIKNPVQRPAAVIGDESSSVVVTLGSRVVLQCYAIGFPTPVITWWRGSRMLPLSSEQLEQQRDHSLVLYSVTLTALGPYTCQAYNGIGRAASWTVTLKAIGPVYSQDPNDITYNQFLVPPPRSPSPNTHPLPPPFSPHRTQPTTTSTTTKPFTPETPRIFVVPVKTNISMEKTVYPVGSDISIPCDVDGYPVPKVTWYKDDQLLQSSDRIQISESSRLTVQQAYTNDTGTYRCEADNGYGSSDSSVSITVEGVYIHPDCTDNPFFADCRLVVKGKYCTHKYYAKFCCKSCTLAGQLPSYGPHLQSSTNRVYRRRRSLVMH